MLFKIVEHIDTYERTISIQPKNECLICFEINTPDKLTPIDLKTQQMYLKMCNCGGWFHITCLCQWYEASNSCPICRVDMKKRETILSKCFFYANNIGWTIVIGLVKFCNILWVLFIWFSLGIMCSYNIYLSHTQQPVRDRWGCISSARPPPHPTGFHWIPHYGDALQS
jgi:hypothetical protein